MQVVLRGQPGIDTGIALFVSSVSTRSNSTSQHVIEIFNPLIKDSGRLILKTSQMSSHDSFSNASVISRASRRSSVARSPSPPSIGAITPTRSVASPVSSFQRQLSTPPPPPRSPVVELDLDVGARSL